MARAEASVSRQPRPPQAQGSPSGRMEHVARFPGVAVPAAQKPAVGDDAGADARPDGQKDHIPHVAARAVPPLAEGGQVGVVVRPHGNSQEALQGGFDLDAVEPARVRRFQNAAALQIEQAGQAEAGGPDRLGRA